MDNRGCIMIPTSCGVRASAVNEKGAGAAAGARKQLKERQQAEGRWDESVDLRGRLVKEGLAPHSDMSERVKPHAA
jgi:hypothetical protein